MGTSSSKPEKKAEETLVARLPSQSAPPAAAWDVTDKNLAQYSSDSLGLTMSTARWRNPAMRSKVAATPFTFRSSCKDMFIGLFEGKGPHGEAVAAYCRERAYEVIKWVL